MTPNLVLCFYQRIANFYFRFAGSYNGESKITEHSTPNVTMFLEYNLKMTKPPLFPKNFLIYSSFTQALLKHGDDECIKALNESEKTKNLSICYVCF
jgi:hypothetical protein